MSAIAPESAVRSPLNSNIEPQQLGAVFPRDFAEPVRRSQLLELCQLHPGQALPVDRGIFRALPGPAAICTRTVTAKHQLVLVPSQKRGGEFSVPSERAASGIGREIAVQIRVVR